MRVLVVIEPTRFGHRCPFNHRSTGGGSQSGSFARGDESAKSTQPGGKPQPRSFPLLGLRAVDQQGEPLLGGEGGVAD
jgi:hypothetical protein